MLKLPVTPFTRIVVVAAVLKLPLIVRGASVVLGTKAAKSTSNSVPALCVKSAAFVQEPPAAARITPTAPALTVIGDAPAPAVENSNLPPLTMVLPV